VLKSLNTSKHRLTKEKRANKKKSDEIQLLKTQIETLTKKQALIELKYAAGHSNNTASALSMNALLSPLHLPL